VLMHIVKFDSGEILMAFLSSRLRITLNMEIMFCFYLLIDLSVSRINAKLIDKFTEVVGLKTR